MHVARQRPCSGIIKFQHEHTNNFAWQRKSLVLVNVSILIDLSTACTSHIQTRNWLETLCCHSSQPCRSRHSNGLGMLHSLGSTVDVPATQHSQILVSKNQHIGIYYNGTCRGGPQSGPHHLSKCWSEVCSSRLSIYQHMSSCTLTSVSL